MEIYVPRDLIIVTSVYQIILIFTNNIIIYHDNNNAYLIKHPY